MEFTKIKHLSSFKLNKKTSFGPSAKLAARDAMDAFWDWVDYAQRKNCKEEAEVVFTVTSIWISRVKAQ